MSTVSMRSAWSEWLFDAFYPGEKYYSHTHTHTHRERHRHTHTHTHTHKHTHTHMRYPGEKYYTRPRARAHTCMHIHTRSLTRTHARAHTHTHTRGVAPTPSARAKGVPDALAPAKHPARPAPARQGASGEGGTFPRALGI